MRLLCFALFLSCLAGCGGSTSGSDGTTGSTGGTTGAGGASSAGGSGGSNSTGGGVGAGGSSSGGASASPCPASPPSSGMSCNGDFECTYGDDPVAECRPVFRCENGAFVEMTLGTICFKPGEGNCPATDPTNGDMCGSVSGPEFTCGYPDAQVCTCAVCVAGPACQQNQPQKWHCAGAPTDPACPAHLPNAGESCAAPASTQCSYGIPCGGGGQAVVCMNGFWKWVAVPCPA